MHSTYTAGWFSGDFSPKYTALRRRDAPHKPKQVPIDVAHGRSAELGSGQQAEREIAFGSSVSLAHVDVQKRHFFVVI